jgi:hypothetical protein
MRLSTRMYDIMKWVTLILLPAIASLYLALAETWGLPNPTVVAGVIAAFDVFLATILGINLGYFGIRRLNSAFKRDSVQALALDNGDWIFNKQTYEALTWIAQVLLPALAALYLALSASLGLPNVDQVVATIMAVDTFLGILLGFSTAQYMKSIATVCVEDNVTASQL